MRILSFLFLLCLWPQFAFALAGDWQETERVKVRLVSAVDAVGDLKEIPLGLVVQLAPTWHAYWRSPGEAGLPPQLDTAASQNLAKLEIAYPWPERKIILGIENFLYEHEVIYPLQLTPQTVGQPVSIKANLSLLTCADICVPNDLTLSLELPAGTATPSLEAPRIAAYQARVPSTENNPEIDLDVKQAMVDLKATGIKLDVAGQNISDPMVIIETPLGLRFEPAKILTTENGTTQLLVPLTNASDLASLQGLKNVTININAEPNNLSSLRLREQTIALTLPTNSESAITTQPMVDTAATPSLFLILLFAFLGGLILNIMPCVLPVLSLKILSVIKHSEYSLGQIRRSFLATSAGIICSFLLLAGILISLRAAGETIGWGIQFQQPLFITLLAMIVTVFAANMLGLFEIRLASDAENALASASDRKGYWGSFLQGAFATILATPCTAPFLGTAAGFAVVAPDAQILMIFLLMGLGLALPYLLLAAFPSLARHMPKPGRWMVAVRHILGLALAATALWLLFVLSGQLELHHLLIIAASLGLLPLLLWLRQKADMQNNRHANVILLAGIGLALVVGISATLMAKPPMRMDDPAAMADEKINWQKFTPEQIPELVQQGKTVFVDVTARWCLTCLYNKRTVLDDPEIIAQLSRPDHIAMLADWTNPDPIISAYLRSFQRSGIPFNVVYGRGIPNGKVLPELLTKDAVLTALQEAEKTP